ncbi:MAG: metallophosphoesterase [Syntrophales bacterium]
MKTISSKAVIGISSLIMLCLSAVIYYDTNTIEIRRYHIEKPDLGQVLKGKKVALLSDPHIIRIGLREENVLRIVAAEKPDIIFMTGDYISPGGRYEPALKWMERLKAPLGIYAVLGNAEYSNESGSCILCHEKNSTSLKKDSTLRFLRNSFRRIEIGGHPLYIVGLDDPVETRRKNGGKDNNDLEKTVKDLDPKTPKILLVHSPEVFEDAVGQGFNLVLCGHNHGGQIFLTRTLRRFFSFESPLAYLEGFFEKGKTLMYVNRGIGASLLPFRIGVRPEITLLTFSDGGDNPAVTGGGGIRNNPVRSAFSGVNLKSICDTFDLFGSLLRKRGTPKTSSISKVLFDFESEGGLETLNWECGKWFELSAMHSLPGSYSLHAVFFPGAHRTIQFGNVNQDWSDYERMKMEVFNPSGTDMELVVRLDDSSSGWDYTQRYDGRFILRPQANEISIPLTSLRTNVSSRPMDLRHIRNFTISLRDNGLKSEFYISDIRLE